MLACYQLYIELSFKLRWLEVRLLTLASSIHEYISYTEMIFIKHGHVGYVELNIALIIKQNVLCSYNK